MAFNNCELRGDLVIPDSVIEIRNGAFGDYTRKSHISSLTLSKNLKSLGSANFLGYQIDGNLEFPATLQAIGNAAFTNAFVSGTVIIPEDSQLSTIGGATFEGFSVKGFGTISYHQERDITQFYNLFRHMDVFDLRNSGITVFGEFKGDKNDYFYKRAADRPGIFDVRGCDLSTFSIGGANNLTLICDSIPDSGISMKAAYTSSNENIAKVTKKGAPKDPGTIVLGDQFGTATLKTIDIDTTNGSYREIRIIHMPSTLKMQYGDKLNISELFQPMNYDVSWSSSDPKVVSVSNGELEATGAGTAVLTATVTPTAGMKHAGSSATLTMDVEVTPLPITFGTNGGENPGGRITYARSSIAPEFSQFATFYPAQVANGNVSIVEGSSSITPETGYRHYICV